MDRPTAISETRRHPRRAPLMLAPCALISVSAAAQGQSVPFTVPVTSNLYYVDRTEPPGCAGSPATVIELLSGTGRRLRVANVSGTTNAGPGWPTVTADGGPNVCGGGLATDLLALNGISSIRHASRCNFLAGVFIAGTPQPGTEPAGLVFLDDLFVTLAPSLQQLFFIGDGLMGDGAPQVICVPDAATRLVLGVPDGGCFRGAPGAYCDNTGSFSGVVAVTACPADFNCSGSLSVQDIFDFLAAYFGGESRADFNASGAISVQDIFDSLAAYFAGCD